jgi:hypothetical protein
VLETLEAATLMTNHVSGALAVCASLLRVQRPTLSLTASSAARSKRPATSCLMLFL